MPLYFIGNLEERNGEYEYQIPVRFTAASKREATKIITKAAKNWYGDYSHKDDNHYYFYGGEVCVCAGGFKEIYKSTYKEIAGYVTEAAT